jgi:hypothetical protein
MGASRALGGFAMSGNSTFRLTFHVFHPSISASEVESAFGLPVRFSQSVGGQRKTKSGSILEGTYIHTNVSFCLHEHPLQFDDVLIDDIIKKQIESYNAKYISMLAETGGKCNFLLGIFSSSSVMFELGNEIIDMLSSSKISMKFDFYGGDE